MASDEEIRALRVGDELPPLHYTARMRMLPERIRWGSVHHDEYARKELGLRGGLVLGVVTMSYVDEMLGRYFGPSWLERGALDVRFIGGGVVNKDELTARAKVGARERDDAGERLDLEVTVENASIENKPVLVGAASYRL